MLLWADGFQSQFVHREDDEIEGCTLGSSRFDLPPMQSTGKREKMMDPSIGGARSDLELQVQVDRPLGRR